MNIISKMRGECPPQGYVRNDGSFILAHHAPTKTGISSIFAVGRGLRPRRNRNKTRFSLNYDCGSPGVRSLPLWLVESTAYPFCLKPQRSQRTQSPLVISAHPAFLVVPEGPTPTRPYPTLLVPTQPLILLTFPGSVPTGFRSAIPTIVVGCVNCIPS